MAKTISIVTVTYNSERFLDETIQSVVTQRGSFFVEYVVIDNCSTDNTLDMLKKYDDEIHSEKFRCNCHGVSFKYISEPDAGMYDALSKGIQMCTGDIFAYINSDDFYLPNAFSTVLRFIDDPEIHWLTGLPTFYNVFGAITPANMPCVYNSRYIRSGVYGKYVTHIQQESTFWRRELFNKIDLKKLASYKYAGDFYLWSEFSKHHKLHTIVAQLSGFRFHDANLSTDDSSYKKEFDSMVVNQLNLLDYPKIFIYKVLFKLFGNKLLRLFLDYEKPKNERHLT